MLSYTSQIGTCANLDIPSYSQSNSTIYGLLVRLHCCHSLVAVGSLDMAGYTLYSRNANGVGNCPSNKPPYKPGKHKKQKETRRIPCLDLKLFS
jgi:hypothetical protein